MYRRDLALLEERLKAVRQAAEKRSEEVEMHGANERGSEA